MEEILEFGIKRENEERRDGGCAIVFYPKIQKFAVYRNLKNGVIGLFGGGFNEGEDEREGVLRELVEESGLTNFLYIEKIEKVATHYYNSNKEVNRIAFCSCYLIVLESDKLQQTKLESHENFEFHWMDAPEILSAWESRNKNHDYDHWVYLFNKGIKMLKDLKYLS
ncbi:MAG: NUDIX hydrolase [Candidatus Nomurabacteria bacterium]|nr:NUDIX hydrolase [Candidatus Nomurabacteria bacterium]